MPEISEQIDAFLEALNKKFPKYAFTRENGSKYVRIVKEDAVTIHYSRAVYCFIDASGNILKAAGWKTPAKGVRGSIINFDISKFDEYGGCFYRR